MTAWPAARPALLRLLKLAAFQEAAGIAKCPFARPSGEGTQEKDPSPGPAFSVRGSLLVCSRINSPGRFLLSWSQRCFIAPNRFASLLAKQRSRLSVLEQWKGDLCMGLAGPCPPSFTAHPHLLLGTPDPANLLFQALLPYAVP